MQSLLLIRFQFNRIYVKSVGLIYQRDEKSLIPRWTMISMNPNPHIPTPVKIFYTLCWSFLSLYPIPQYHIFWRYGRRKKKSQRTAAVRMSEFSLRLIIFRMCAFCAFDILDLKNRKNKANVEFLIKWYAGMAIEIYQINGELMPKIFPSYRFNWFPSWSCQTGKWRIWRANRWIDFLFLTRDFFYNWFKVVEMDGDEMTRSEFRYFTFLIIWIFLLSSVLLFCSHLAIYQGQIDFSLRKSRVFVLWFGSPLSWSNQWSSHNRCCPCNFEAQCWYQVRNHHTRWATCWRI